MIFWLNWLPVIGTYFLTVCYVPQIKKLILTKVTDGMSLSFWIHLDIALLILTVNQLFVFLVYGTWGTLVTEAVNLVLAVVVTGLFIKYKKYNEANEANN